MTYEGAGSYKEVSGLGSTDNVSVADVSADLTAAGLSKAILHTRDVDSTLVQQTFTDALNENYNERYVSTPYADIGEYLKTDVTYYEVVVVSVV